MFVDVVVVDLKGRTNNKGNRNTSHLFEMAAPGKFNMKINDCKVHFFSIQTLFWRTKLSSKLIAKIILLGLKLFISGSGGSF